MKGRYPKTEQELAERFEAGEDLESLGFDVSDAKVEKPSFKRVNVDFPEAMAMLDHEAQLRCINRQALRVRGSGLGFGVPCGIKCVASVVA